MHVVVLKLLKLELKTPGRLDQALLQALRAQGYAALSRAQLKTQFAAKQVLLNGRPAPASLELQAGSYDVQLPEPPGPPKASASEDLQIPLIYQDDHLLVLNKPSGIPSAPLGPNEPRTAVGAALALHPELAQVGRGGLEPGLLHRLDTGTSGLLVFARTQEAYDRLRESWSRRQVRKVYRAMTSTRLPLGSHHLMLAHDARSSKKMRPADSGPTRGKPLETITHIRAYHGSLNGSLDHEIEIETGVMHQIRCTLASLGAPIRGDSIYGGAPDTRLWLHAWRLELRTPRGSILRLEAPLPLDWPHA